MANLFNVWAQQALSIATGELFASDGKCIKSTLTGGNQSCQNFVSVVSVYTAVCGFMGYSYLQKPHSERGREFKVSPICLRTAVVISKDGSLGIKLWRIVRKVKLG